jgi:hypothetical protein
VRIVSLRGETAPHFDAVQVEFPPGLVAVLGTDGRLRARARRMLAGLEEGVRVSTLPRVPDPILTRLPAPLRMALEAGEGVEDAADVVQAGARALALLNGYDRVEAARNRVMRMRGRPGRTVVGAEAEALMARIRELEGAPRELAALEDELQGHRADDAEVSGEVELANLAWMRERQDAETQLQTYRDRARELRTRIADLESAEDDAPCPTCGRALADHLEDVLSDLRDEWESLVQDGSWWRRRREQLEEKPDPLQQLEERSLRLRDATEKLVKRVELARSRVRELESAQVRLAEHVGGGAPMVEEEAGEVRIPEAVLRTLDQILARTADAMRRDAREAVLARMSRILARITGGRILSARWLEAGRLDLFGVEGSLHPPVEEDAAAAHIAARIASAQILAARAGTPFPPLILGESFDRLDEAVQIRTVDELRGIVGPVFEQVLLVTRGDVVDFYPESFSGIVELRRDSLAEPSVLRTVPAGLGLLRLA